MPRKSVLYAIVFCSLRALMSGQNVSPKKKVLTPEQQRFQEEVKQYMAQRQDLQSSEKQIYDAEMAREKLDDCPNASTTYDFNVCYGKQVSATGDNLKKYEKGLRDLLALKYPEFPGEQK